MKYSMLGGLLASAFSLSLENTPKYEFPGASVKNYHTDNSKYSGEDLRELRRVKGGDTRKKSA